MYRITEKRDLNPEVALMKVDAPRIAKKAKSGQFIILRIDEAGERIPLTIANANKDTGEITIVFQKVGQTTSRLYEMEAGQSLQDFVGPLGQPSHIDGYKNVAVLGGGLGTAIAWPQAKGLYDVGTKVDLICGFRNKDLIILEDEFKQ
ncbi:sulfide/dihydroorotate dehydrogenase-like FAD/NAD-binding protein, partial [Eubacteriales bacterium OttesenSCG-928-M02]|nr:sulfide/dihydroorotate dehydrogenase-like FAD/NAD-binding protein [Eubacteriales bacterium OttesenSCG-928-M02]